MLIVGPGKSKGVNNSLTDVLHGNLLHSIIQLHDLNIP